MANAARRDVLGHLRLLSRCGRAGGTDGSGQRGLWYNALSASCMTFWMMVVMQDDDEDHSGRQAAESEDSTPMGHSQAEKAQNRERILAAAAEQIRDSGLESVSVGKLMQAVNLTHGGFYGHFASRSDLLAQALKQALLDGENMAQAAAAASGRPRSFANFVRSYLSRTHRDSRNAGCAISALISDVGRADTPSRAVMEAHIEGYIAAIDRGLGADDEAKAITAVSAMVGALAISRVITDPKRSDAILKAVRDQVIALQPDARAQD
jgi:TetR/AcrR family transcriptional repressor of nem operon